MGWIGSNCRQSDQYRKNFGPSRGGRLKKVGKSESARTHLAENRDGPIPKPSFATKSSYASGMGRIAKFRLARAHRRALLGEWIPSYLGTERTRPTGQSRNSTASRRHQ